MPCGYNSFPQSCTVLQPSLKSSSRHPSEFFSDQSFPENFLSHYYLPSYFQDVIMLKIKTFFLGGFSFCLFVCFFTGVPFCKTTHILEQFKWFYYWFILLKLTLSLDLCCLIFCSCKTQYFLGIHCLSPLLDFFMICLHTRMLLCFVLILCQNSQDLGKSFENHQYTNCLGMRFMYFIL